MIKFPRYWNKTLTVYHQNTDYTWKKSFYDNCFWGKKEKQSINGNELIKSKIQIVRIPLPAQLEKGDIVALGKISEDIKKGDSGNEFLSKNLLAFRVNEVSVNGDVGVKHIKGCS